MVGENRIAQQIDSKVCGKMLEERFDPFLSVVEVLPAERVVTHQEATSNGPIDDVRNRHLLRIDDLSAAESGHGSTGEA